MAVNAAPRSGSLPTDLTAEPRQPLPPGLDSIAENLAVFLKLKVAYSQLTRGARADVAYWTSARSHLPMRLWVHPVIGFEEGPGEREQRAVAWVIERFNAGNSLGKMRFDSLDISHELSLGIRWTRDQDRPGLRDGLSHAFEELLIDWRMTAITGISLVMNVLVRMGTAHGCAIDFRRIELKHLRLAVIDPDQCVIVTTHTLPPQTCVRSPTIVRPGW